MTIMYAVLHEAGLLQSESVSLNNHRGQIATE